MLNPDLKSILAQGYSKLGDITFKIAVNLRKGKDHIPKQQALYEQGIKMRILLKILFRHIEFSDTLPPVLYRITEQQVNNYLRCLIKLGDLEQYPIYPSTLPNTKPVIIAKGEKGETGNPGLDGSNAFIIVQPKVGEDQIIVESSVVGLVKTYNLSFQSYVKQLLTAAVQGTKIFEIGTVNNITVNITSTKGTRDLVSLTSSNGTINTLLQPLVVLATLNGVSQPVLLELLLANQEVSLSLPFQSNDGKNTVATSDSISYVYPFMYGSNDNILTEGQYYTNLTRLLALKANRSFLFNGVDKYFYIAFPSSYGTIKIYDQNGFEATAAFTSSLLNLPSTGLTNDWTTEYRVYRTTIKTDINNANFSIVFQ